MDNDTSDNETDAAEDELHMIRLSEKDKLPILEVWVNSIIFKPYGKKILFHLLEFPVRQLWKPMGIMHLMDLDHDYHLARFHLDEAYTSIVAGGPWFISGQYLITRLANRSSTLELRRQLELPSRISYQAFY